MNTIFLKYTKNVLFILTSIVVIIFMMTCEEQVFDNPYDAEAVLDPTEWAPTNLNVWVISDSEIKLNWSQLEKRISGFRIDRQANSGSFTKIAEVDANENNYLDTGLTYGTDYTYRIKAFTDNNESDYDASNTTNTSFPSPTNLVATPINDSEIELTWTDNCDFESGYKIDRSEDGSNFTQISELSENITEHVDTELTYGTDYTYRVKAFTEENESNYVESNKTDLSLPTPTNLTATPINVSDIKIIWIDNCSFEEGFRIERSDGGGFIEIIVLGENNTEYTDRGLNYGTDYTYRVYTFLNENESDYSETTVWSDCNGDWYGTAFVNVCDFCVGGITGINENYCETVFDIDGNEYNTIIIGDQAWMAENLKVTHYQNSDEIPTEYSADDWTNLSIGAYAVFNGNENNAETYGYLYNWKFRKFRTVIPVIFRTLILAS